MKSNEWQIVRFALSCSHGEYELAALALSRLTALTSTADQPPFFWVTFHRSPQPMALLEPGKVFVAINDAFTAAFGYTPEQVVGTSADRIISPDDRAEMRRTWQLMLDSGRIEYARDIVHAQGHLMRIRGASERGFVTGRDLVLTVALAQEPRDRNSEGFPSTPSRQAGAGLTPREREVFQLLASGLNAPEIADRLFLSPATVRTHVQNGMQRLGARTRVHAISIALGRGEIDP
jgi:PAS domain S-box-containing protein